MTRQSCKASFIKRKLSSRARNNLPLRINKSSSASFRAIFSRIVGCNGPPTCSVISFLNVPGQAESPPFLMLSPVYYHCRPHCQESTQSTFRSVVDTGNLPEEDLFLEPGGCLWCDVDDVVPTPPFTTVLAVLSCDVLRVI